MAVNNLNETLKDVRRSYRLLYEYQRRVMDLVRYIGNNYGYHDDPDGWSWFSHPAPANGKSVDLKSWAWDWLAVWFPNLAVFDIMRYKEPIYGKYTSF